MTSALLNLSLRRKEGKEMGGKRREKEKKREEAERRGGTGAGHGGSFRCSGC